MRKYRKALALISAACLCSTLISVPQLSASASSETLPDFPCGYSASANDQVYEYFTAGELNTYTAEEAALAGVPTGYTDNVISLASANGTYDRGILLLRYMFSILTRGPELPNPRGPALPFLRSAHYERI